MRKKIGMVFILAVVYAFCGMFYGERIYAADMETIEGAEPEETAPMGVLVLENDAASGSVNVIYDDKQATVSCDYFELEIPLDAVCFLAVHPFSGYGVEAVCVNGESIDGQDGRYCVSLEEGLVMVTVKYEKIERAEGEDEDCDESVRGNTDSVSNQVYGRGDFANGQTSVSAISYDVKVTYLDVEPADGSSLESKEKAKNHKGENNAENYSVAIAQAGQKGSKPVNVTSSDEERAGGERERLDSCGEDLKESWSGEKDGKIGEGNDKKNDTQRNSVRSDKDVPEYQKTLEHQKASEFQKMWEFQKVLELGKGLKTTCSILEDYTNLKSGVKSDKNILNCLNSQSISEKENNSDFQGIGFLRGGVKDVGFKDLDSQDWNLPNKDQCKNQRQTDIQRRELFAVLAVVMMINMIIRNRKKSTSKN